MIQLSRPILSLSRPTLRPVGSSLRFISTPDQFSPSTPTPDQVQETKQKAKADWKRRQAGSNFIDTLSLTVTSGKGGSGGVSFHREKFKARGPPSGGPGGTGGSVYLIATPTVTSLSHLPRTIRGGPGSSGGGKWLAGKRGEDVVVRVPVGTVVREVDEEYLRSEEEEERERVEREGLEWSWEVNKVKLHEAEKRDKRWNAWKKVRDAQEKFGLKEGEEPIEPWEELEEQEFEPEKLEALSQFRKKMFTMYPQAELTGHPSFLATEHHLLSKILSREVELPGIKKPRRRPRHARRKRSSGQEEEEEPLLYYDLNRPTPIDEPILLVSGGSPGLGNPSFLTHEDRSPKYATKGGAGETMRLTLEVKSNGEVGLVGLPNAGKSTLLRALTSSTPRVASFAFTTLNPHLGTCVVYSDGTFSGPKEDNSHSTSSSSSPNASLGDTPSNPTHFSGTSSPSSTSSPSDALDSTLPDKRHKKKKEEKIRFTLTDNPGLLPQSHLNHGLGHEFLRHIERCTSLIYVVDLSSTPYDATEGGGEGGGEKMGPIETLRVLENSLREYEKMRGMRPGELVGRVKGVVGNKADLFGKSEEQSEEERSSVEDGIKRLGELKEYVKGLSVDQKEVIEEKRKQRGYDDESGEEGTVEEAVEKEPMWVIPISAKNRQNVGPLVQQLVKDVEFEREKKKRLALQEIEEGFEPFDKVEEKRIEEDEDHARWIR